MSDNSMSAASLASSHTLPTARVTPFDPPPALEQFREQSPLHRLRYPDGHIGWLVTSHQLAREVLADKSFSSRMDLMRLPVRRPAVDSLVGKPTPPGWFLGMDRPEHGKYRRLLAGQFTSRKMEYLRPRIEGIVDSAIHEISQYTPPVDLVTTFAQVIPSFTICELLGVPSNDRANLHRANETLLNTDTSPEQGADAWEQVYDCLRQLVEYHKANREHDLYTTLIDLDELSDDELVGIGALLLTAGLDTVANMLALGTFALLCHPAQLKRLLNTPTLIDTAVEELLRYLTIFQHGLTRTATEGVDILNEHIRAGESVTIALSAANRDPNQFKEPAELDIARSAKGHLAFGHGIHQCLGQHLARVEMRIAYLKLFDRFPSLALYESPDQVPLRSDMASYGVRRLLVSW